MQTTFVHACSSSLARSCGRSAALALLAVLLSPIGAFAGHVRLAWDPSPEAFVAGYVVYYGTTSGVYTWSVDVGNTTTYTINGLTNGVTFYFTVKAYSTGGTLSSPSNQVSGVPTNLPPSITNPGSFTMKQGALTLPIVATDPDFDPLTYSAVGLPSGLAINSTTGLISGTIAPGTHTITARASDGATTVSVTFVVTVTVNNAPTLAAPGDQNNDTNDVVNLQLAAADLDLDPLTFSATGLPAGLTLNASTGRITGTPATGTGGAHPVTVTVTDGSLSASRSFTWNVTDLNPGLVAAYGFDEGSGTSTADASGNSHTGTISGATWTTSGRFGKALTFDGVNDWVTVADSTLLSLTSQLTLEAWVYPTANGASSWRNVAVKEGTTAPYNLYANDSTSVPAVEVRTAAQPTVLQRAPGASQLPLNTWAHLAVTYDGTTLRLFVNGVQVGSTAVSGALMTSTGPLRIGGNSMWGEFFQGRIDELRIYNVARSAAQIAADMAAAVTGNPPTLTNPGNRTNAENDVVSLALAASDPDGDAITYSATGLPPSLTVNAGTGVISGTLSYASAGSHTIVVTATAAGASDSKTFTWTVTNTNRAPVVTSPGDQSGSQGVAVSVGITATDPDGDALTFSAASLPTGLAINASSGVVSGTPTALGVFATVVTVSDGTTPASASLSWTITLAAATLLTPSGTIATATPGFSWTAVSGATQYQLWVNDTSLQPRIDSTYTAAAVGCGAGTGTCTMAPGVALAQGAATWWIRTSNAAGPGAWSTVLNFTVPAPPDTTAPTVAVTIPTSTGTYTATSGTLGVSGTASDNIGVTQVSWTTDRGGSGVATGTTAWTAAAVPLGVGTTVITVTARDAANNTRTATLTVTYNLPPGAATLVAPSGAIANATASFSWAAVSGATDYQLWVNDTSLAPRINTTYTAAAAGCSAGTGTCTMSPGVTLAPGAATWWIRASNTAGVGPWSTALAFTVPAPPDSTAPTVGITIPTSTGTYTATSGTLGVSGTAGDNVGVTQVSWTTNLGGSGVATGTTGWTIAAVPLGTGTTVLTVTARDAANNTASATMTVTYNPASTPPGAATLLSPSGSIANATPSFSWAAVSGATEYQLWVNDTSLQPRINTTYTAAAAGCGAGTGTCTLSPAVTLAPGQAHWWIRASNAAGAGPWSVAFPFTVPGSADTTAPTIAMTTPTTTGTYAAAGATLAVSGTANDNVGVTQVSWTTDRGGSGVATGTTAWTIAAVPLGAGTTVITVTARDAVNNTANATLTVTYDLSAPGAATLLAPSGTLANATPSFTWTAVAGAAEYQLWVNDTSQQPRINTTYTAAAVGCSAGTGTCTVSPGVTLAPGPGHWWIRASNGAGAGPWSTAVALTVP